MYKWQNNILNVSNSKRQVWSLLFKWNWKVLWFKANFNKSWVSVETHCEWRSHSECHLPARSQWGCHKTPVMAHCCSVYMNTWTSLFPVKSFLSFWSQWQIWDLFIWFYFYFFYFYINFVKWKMSNSEELLPQLPWATAWLYHFVRVWFVHSQLNLIAGRKDESWVGTKAKQ